MFVGDREHAGVAFDQSVHLRTQKRESAEKSGLWDVKRADFIRYWRRSGLNNPDKPTIFIKKNVRNHSYHQIYPVWAKIRINRGLLYHWEFFRDNLFHFGETVATCLKFWVSSADFDVVLPSWTTKHLSETCCKSLNLHSWLSRVASLSDPSAKLCVVILSGKMQNLTQRRLISEYAKKMGYKPKPILQEDTEFHPVKQAVFIAAAGLLIWDVSVPGFVICVDFIRCECT